MSQLPRIAARNVTRNRRRSAITFAAILFGVAAVVTLRGFVGGTTQVMVDDVVKSKAGAMQIHRKGYWDSLDSSPLTLSLPHSPEFIAKLKAVEGVAAVSPRIQFSGLVSNGRSQTMFVGRGIDPVLEKEALPNSGALIRPGGRALQPGDNDQATVGGELAESFNAVPRPVKEKALAEGNPKAQDMVDFVTLSTQSPEGRANSMDVQVVGLTKSSYAFENKRILTVPLPLAQSLLGLEGKVTEYAVAVDDVSKVDEVVKRLEAALGPDFEVHPWTEIQPFFRDAIVRIRFVLGLVSGILLLIVLSGIINTMLMSVFERVREIGTMMACGVRRRQVMSLFVMEAAVLGFLGGLAGGALGRGIVELLHRKGIPMKAFGAAEMQLMRPTVEMNFVALAAVVALIGAMAAALYPAWKASRLNPVDALRST